MKEEQELEDCTFEPQTSKARKSSAPMPSSGSSMHDRARQMEARKQERMQKIRQEILAKEMSQCSFHPRITALAERASDGVTRRASAPNVGTRQQSAHRNTCRRSDV